MNIDSVNPLYFIVDKVHDFIEEKEGNKYLNFPYTNKNVEVLVKYMELWDGIKNHIQKINKKPGGKYGKDYIKIKLNSDDDLHLDKPLKFHDLTLIVKSVLKKMVNTIHNFFQMTVCMSYTNERINVFQGN